MQEFFSNNLTISFNQNFIIYSAAFRQIFLPFITKAFDKLRLFNYNKHKDFQLIEKNL